MTVRCDEAGCPPTFEGVITGVYFGRRTGELTYAVLADGIMCDGYTEDWLTPIAANEKVSDGAGGKRGT